MLFLYFALFNLICVENSLLCTLMSFLSVAGSLERIMRNLDLLFMRIAVFLPVVLSLMPILIPYEQLQWFRYIMSTELHLPYA